MLYFTDQSIMENNILITSIMICFCPKLKCSFDIQGYSNYFKTKIDNQGYVTFKYLDGTWRVSRNAYICVFLNKKFVSFSSKKFVAISKSVISSIVPFCLNDAKWDINIKNINSCFKRSIFTNHISFQILKKEIENFNSVWNEKVSISPSINESSDGFPLIIKFFGISSQIRIFKGNNGGHGTIMAANALSFFETVNKFNRILCFFNSHGIESEFSEYFGSLL